jgi:type I restriction enzyme M protein
VPDGVLFGSSKAHVETRKRIIEENRLDGVVSMPSGVFKPYAGVSTAVLLFTRGATTDRVWFYDMEHDGFSLDDKRQPVTENDIPNVLECWENRLDAKFNSRRDKRLKELKQMTEPLKAERLRLQKEINRAQFENVIDGQDLSGLQDLTGLLDKLHDEIAPLQAEMNQLTRQFWVTKEQVRANKYDLSASRYRQVEQDEEFYEEPQVTLERLKQLGVVAEKELEEIASELK